MSWLLEYRSLAFNDLTTEQTRSLFEKDFVRDWNDGRLSQKYYGGGVRDRAGEGSGKRAGAFQAERREPRGLWEAG